MAKRICKVCKEPISDFFNENKKYHKRCCRHRNIYTNLYGGSYCLDCKAYDYEIHEKEYGHDF